MNHIYKLKFDRRLLELIVVSELATKSVSGSNLATPSEEYNQSYSVASNSIYDYSLSELINSIVNLSYSLENTTNITTTDYQILTANTINKSTNFSKANFRSLNTNNYNFNKRNLLALSLLVGSFGVATNVLAAPTVYGTHGQEGTVVAGTVSSVTDGLVTTITNSPNAIIDWKQFNINQNEILKFVQKTADSAVLNRVLGNQVSKILGTLQSNGQVFIVNPNGIVFGSKSHVDVGGLVASTLDINNNDFLHGHYVFNQAKDQAIAKVLNSGVIKVNNDGSLALIGGQVVNNGVLEAKHGTVFLLAGNSIEIVDLHNPLVSYKVTAKNKAVNLGRVLGQNAVLLGNQVLNGKASKYTAGTFADVIGSEDTSANQASINADGQVVLFGGSQANTLQSTDQANSQVVGKRNGVIVNNGKINVSNAHGKAGKVQVLGDTVVLDANSKIYATGRTGGEVLIGGDATGKGTLKLAHQTYLDQNQLIDLSAEDQAGHAVIWADQTHLDGNFKATSVNGEGGFIETSGHVIDFGNKNFNVDVASEYAKAGTWLVDPDYIVVTNMSALTKIKESDQDYTGNNYYLTGNDHWDISKSPTVLDKDSSTNKGTTYILDSSLSKQLTGKKVELTACYTINFDHAKVEMNKDTTANSNLLLKAENNVDGHPSVIGFNNSTFTGNSINISIEEDNRAPVRINNSTFTNTGTDQGYILGNGLVQAFSINNSTLTGFNKGITLINYIPISYGLYITNSTIDFGNRGDINVITLNKDNPSSRSLDRRANFINSTIKVGTLNVTTSQFGDNFVSGSSITINLKNTNLTVANNLDLSSDYLKIVNSTISSPQANLNFGEGVTIDKGKLTTTNQLYLKSEGFVNLTNSTITSTQSNVKLNVYREANLTNLTIVANKEIKLNSTSDTSSTRVINLDKVNLTSNTGRVGLKGHIVNVSNSHINSVGQAFISIDYNDSKKIINHYDSLKDYGYMHINNSSITASKFGVSLTSKSENSGKVQESIKVTNSTLNGFGDVYISSKNKTSLENTTLLSKNAATGEVRFEIKDLSLTNVTVDTPSDIVIAENYGNNIIYERNGYNVDIEKSKLTSQNQLYIGLGSNNKRADLKIVNSTLSSKVPTTLNLSGNIVIENSHLTSTDESIYLGYTNPDVFKTEINNTTFNSAKDITFNRSKDKIYSNNLTLTTDAGNISINANYTCMTDVHLHSGVNISISTDVYNLLINENSSLVAKNNINLTSSGHVVLTGKSDRRVLVNSTAGEVKLSANGYTSSSYADIEGNEIYVTGFSLYSNSYSKYSSRSGDINFKTYKAFMSIDNTTLVSNHDINVDSNFYINLGKHNSFIATDNINLISKKVGGIYNYDSSKDSKRLFINSTTGNVLIAAYNRRVSLQNATINANNIKITNIKDSTTDLGSININNSRLNGTLGVVLESEDNSNLANNRIISTHGGINVVSNSGKLSILDNHLEANKLINFNSYSNITVDRNDLISLEGVKLSTAKGFGTVLLGKNTYNDNVPIKVNFDTTNPVVCLYGSDNSHHYIGYKGKRLCYDADASSSESGNNGGVAPVVPKPSKPTISPQDPSHNSPNNNGNSENNSGSGSNSGISSGIDSILGNNDNSNVVNTVTQDLHDDISSDPNNLALTNDLGTLRLIKPENITSFNRSLNTEKNVALANTCRPRFITLVDVYKINIRDIRYISQRELMYKYKLNAEQVEFLFNCYARNLSYFNRLFENK